MSEAPYPLDGTSGAQVVPVSDALGGEIRGIDLSRDMGDATFEAIHQAWLRRLVLLFRDQDLSAAGQVAFSRRNAGYINGLSVEDSEALLDEIWAHTTQDRFTWHHEWRVGDLLIWDNRCTMHRRDGFDSQSRRIMHRTQIIDDQPPSSGEIP